jgi:hypothetical protein
VGLNASQKHQVQPLPIVGEGAYPICTSDLDQSNSKAMQPKTDADDVSAAIEQFEAALPGWWWSICV